MTRTRSITRPVPRMSTLTRAVLLSLAGCATKENIPVYPATQPSTVIAAIQSRSTSLHAATGKGAVSLSSPKRGSVRLDAAFVLAPPDRARVRAWKFNQAVFDLTVTGDGVWLYSPRDPSAENSSSNVGAGIRDWLKYLGVGVPANSVVRSETDRTLTLEASAQGGTLTTTLDRPTRTVRRYRLVDDHGVERFTLTLGQYRDFAGTIWPTKIEAKSASGTITVETSELQPNVAASAAFTPPSRAKRLP